LKQEENLKAKKTYIIMAKRKEVKKVNWVLCLIMSIIFGSLGVDRFIMGKVGTGILKLITAGGLGIWWLVDVILIATKHNYKGVKWVD
jgi:TM2 domain-containing membrane protein YozV